MFDELREIAREDNLVRDWLLMIANDRISRMGGLVSLVVALHKKSKRLEQTLAGAVMSSASYAEQQSIINGERYWAVWSDGEIIAKLDKWAEIGQEANK